MRTIIYFYPTGRADVQYVGATVGRDNDGRCPGGDPPYERNPFDEAHRWGDTFRRLESENAGARAMMASVRMVERQYCGRCGCIRMVFESREDA